MVTLVVASKVEVAALLDTLRRAGLTCSGVGIDTTAAVNAASVDLQPPADKPPRRLSRVHQINIGLIVLAALLALVAIILPIWQKREAVKELIPRAEKSGTEFLISERVYSEYTKLAAEYNFLAARKHAVYPVVSVLEELARTFPDTTWVQKLDIKPNGKVREVTLLGEALSTSKVIENLEQSPLSLFQNSKPQSATRLQSTTERFQVSTEIKPRPVPALEGIEEIASVMSPASIPASPAAVAPVDATIPSASGVLVAPVNPQARAAAVAPSVPTAPATSVTKGGAPTAPSNPPLTTFNGPPGTQYPPPIVQPPSFNSPLGQSQNSQNPPPGSLSPPPIVPTPSFNPPLIPSQNTQNLPPGSLSPPAIVPPPALVPPGKANGL